ncbi:P-type conjugative transfer protein TrbG [Sphingopyxis sp. KK2]|uniref:P-type conjugative transfer protein TrbG n=1 Tax=Sphingopyxis sp. KK2 TaxID=1855727 RepID=UPI00097E6994|nr:P-type conjugative transfer protein TrbG [Sphingopyxis sp. KK2]
MSKAFLAAIAAVTILHSPAVASNGSPAERVRAGTAAALKEPRAQDYRGAVQTYPYVEGDVFRLIAAPEHVTDIALQEGEALQSVAAGDTARWIVGDTVSGAGDSRRVHIMIKPLAPGLSTNLIITTDRRVYHVALTSTTRTAMAAISWSYPDDSLIAIRRAAERVRESAPAHASIEPVNFGFAYTIRGDKPAWRPLRAFDDGRQVFIEFPATLGQGEAPPLFITGDDGSAELVNYRVSGRFYIVDRLFERAELRHGAKKQVIVRIVRKSPSGAAK